MTRFSPLHFRGSNTYKAPANPSSTLINNPALKRIPTYTSTLSLAPLTALPTMLFTTSLRSCYPTTALYTILLASLALLATTPMSAEADCVIQCTSISAKILFCGNIKNGFTDTMPTIGVDPQIDSCLCTQDNVHLYSNCLACKDLSTAVNTTDQFISDCKITDSSRNLVEQTSGAFSRHGSLPSVATHVAGVMASLAIAAALGC